MKPVRKPGVASFIVVTLLTLVLIGIGTAGERELFLFSAAVFLWFVWLSGWRRHRKLAAHIEELSAAVEAGRHESLARIENLEAQIAGTQAPDARTVSAVAAPVAAASAAAAAPSSVGKIAPAQAAYQPGGSVAPPPPPPMPPHEAAANLSFAQVETAPLPSGPTVFERLRSLLKFEETLGTNWMAKIGALILVIGVAYGLVLALKTLGPWGKVGLAWLVGAALLGAGIFLERKESYRIAARAAVAAGWAIIFFTAYAMNHIDTTRVLDSSFGDLLLMIIVAAAMVVHTLRYRSQVATGLAFLAAFSAIFVSVFPSKEISPPDVYSLLASAVLAAFVAVVALRMQWYVLEVGAIGATYFNHFVWLIHIIRPMGKHHHAFPEFLPSAGILISYWAVFRFSYLWRRAGDHERISTLAALLNTGLLLALLKYQSVHPEYAFWALLALGAIELGLGQLPTAKVRSAPHIVLTVVGACLLITAIPFRLGLRQEFFALFISLVWLAEAEAFFLVGVLTQEKVFRRVGLFAFVPLAGQIVSMHAAAIFGKRMDGTDVRGEFVATLITALVAFVLYFNVHWAPRRWSAQFESIVEKLATRDLSYAAAILAFAAGWMACPLLGAAVCWMALACGLAWVARRTDLQPLRVQSIALAAFAFIRVLAVNLPSESHYHLGTRQWPARLLTVAAIVILGYLAAHWHRPQVAVTSWLSWIEAGFSWAASTMLTLLLWYELSSASVVLGWGLFALLIFEIGILRASTHLRLQAYVACVCVFLRILFVNLNVASAEYWGPRVYTIAPLAALFFYLYWRLAEQQDVVTATERKVKAAEILAWLGTTTIVLMLRFEAHLDWVATAWAATAFALMALAWWSGKRVFAHQAMLLSVGVLFRGVLHNLYERSYFTPPKPIIANLSTVTAAAFLFATLFFAFRVRSVAPEGEKKSWLLRAGRLLDARPEQALFFAALVLVTAYLGVEPRGGLVTLAWSLEAVVVFIFAMWVGERSFRLSAMGLFLLCVGKVIIVDMRHMVLRDKFITFSVLGALLMGVSILYSKNREKVRQYL